MKTRAFIIFNFLVIISFNFGALNTVELYTYGLIFLTTIDSIYFSRIQPYWKASWITIFFIGTYILTKYLINLIGGYKIILDDGNELPFYVQVLAGTGEFVFGALISLIIIGISQRIRKPDFNREKNDILITQIGNEASDKKS